MLGVVAVFLPDLGNHLLGRRSESLVANLSILPNFIAKSPPPWLFKGGSAVSMIIASRWFKTCARGG
jgi:hypothetical protein